MPASPIVIDVDAHVTEPETLFTDRVSSKWGDLVPHVKYEETRQEDAWFIGDTLVAPAWASASAGYDKLWPEYPKVKSQAMAASYDADERLKVMDLSGVTVQGLYPNLAGFGGQTFLRLGEPELMLECVRAYNDFLIDWISPAPDRFIANASLPIWDVDEAVKELQRARSIGHKGALFSGAPHELGMPYISDSHWDPLWAAAQEAGMAISFHVGSGDMTKSFSIERIMHEGLAVTYARSSTELFLAVGQQLNDLLLSGVLPRFPELKFVLVESGAGWVPFVLESADYHFLRGGVRDAKPIFEGLPSDYFRRQCFVTAWFEELPSTTYDIVGPENIMFETDFPHPTCIWGDEVPEHIDRLPSEPKAREAILWKNAAELYDVDIDAVAPATAS